MTEQHPSATDSHLLLHLAEHAASALENARLYEEALSRARELEMLLHVSQIVSSTIDLDEVLHLLANELVNSLRVTFCHISLLDESGKRLIIKANTRASARPDVMRQIALEIPLDRAPGLKRALRGGQPLLLGLDLPSHELDLDELELIADQATESMLLVPLIARERVLGMVVVGEQRRSDRAPITPQKIALCQAMATQAAMAIEKARLFSVKSDFLSMISHELRSPLASINASAELLRRRPDGPRSAELLELIQRQTLRLGSFLEDLLNVSRLDEGALELRLEPLPLLPLLSHVIAMAQATTNIHALQLKSEEDIPLVMADPRKVEVVVVNLLRNAINYSPAGGVVTVEVCRQGDEKVAVSVEDQGIGIPTDQLDRVFDRFARLGNDYADAVQGHGLGLYIARGIVEQHGGSIWAESRMGEGSRFSFTLPTFREEAATKTGD